MEVAPDPLLEIPMVKATDTDMAPEEELTTLRLLIQCQCPRHSSLSRARYKYTLPRQRRERRLLNGVTREEEKLRLTRLVKPLAPLAMSTQLEREI